MNSRIPVIIGVAVILIVCTVAVWKPIKDDSSSAIAERPTQASDSRLSDRPDNFSPPSNRARETVSHPDVDPATMEEQARIGRDRLTSQFVENGALSLKQAKDHLVADLELATHEVTAVEKIFDRREAKLAELIDRMNSAEDDSANSIVKEICAVIRNKGLREDLAGILADGQLKTFDQREAKRHQDTVEARAYRDMAEVNAVVTLSEEQKPKLLAALMEKAEERVEKEADARAFMSLTYGSLAAEMDSSHVRGLANMMNPEADKEPNFQYGSAEHQQWMMDNNTERIADELSTVRDILDEDQLVRYRAHLEAEPPR